MGQLWIDYGLNYGFDYDAVIDTEIIDFAADEASEKSSALFWQQQLWLKA